VTAGVCVNNVIMLGVESPSSREALGEDCHGFGTARGRFASLPYGRVIWGGVAERTMAVERNKERMEMEIFSSLAANEKKFFPTPQNKTCTISPSNPSVRLVKENSK